MRRVVGILALLTLGAAPQGAPISSLEGYWKLDETSGTTAADSSGQGHPGTLAGGALISTEIAPMPATNQRSVALANATNNQHINVASSADFDFMTGFTLACWVRPTGTPNTQMGLIERWSSGTSAINGYLLRMGRIGDPATAHNIKINVGNGTSGVEAAQNTAVPLNVWTHVAATWDGTDLRLYRNGSMVAMNSAGSGAVTASAAALEIGQSGPHRLQGNIDEVYTFNAPLSAAQIGILVNGQPPPTAPLVVTPNVNQLSVSWGPAPDAVSYNIYRASGPGSFALIGTSTTTSYTDLTATYPGTYSYQITAVGFMESAPLGPASGTPASPIPRTNGHDEGLIGDRCACGSTIPFGPTSWAALAALALLLRRKR